jgi:hypothetical protein
MSKSTGLQTKLAYVKRMQKTKATSENATADAALYLIGNNLGLLGLYSYVVNPNMEFS